MLVGTGKDLESNVEEKELVQFVQVEDFLGILFSDDFYPGGLERQGQASVAAKEVDRQKVAKGEDSLRKLTSIVSGKNFQFCLTYCLLIQLDFFTSPYLPA